MYCRNSTATSSQSTELQPACHEPARPYHCSCHSSHHTPTHHSPAQRQSTRLVIVAHALYRLGLEVIEANIVYGVLCHAVLFTREAHTHTHTHRRTHTHMDSLCTTAPLHVSPANPCLFSSKSFSALYLGRILLEKRCNKRKVYEIRDWMTQR